MEMTPKLLKKIAIDDKGYGTPHLNEVLYLHHRVSRRPLAFAHDGGA